MKKIWSILSVTAGLLGLCAMLLFFAKTKPASVSLSAAEMEALFSPNSYMLSEKAVFKSDENSKMADKIFDIPAGIDLADFKIFNDKIFMSDAFAKKVFCYSLKGEKIWESQGLDKFIVPNEKFPLDISPDGELWVANTGRLRLENLNLETGKFVASWTPKENFAGCCNPVEFVALGQGAFAAMEKGTCEIRLFDAAGNSKILAGSANVSNMWLKYNLRVDAKNLHYYDGRKNKTLINAL